MAKLEGLSEEQLATISKACELLARLCMGQLEEVVELFPSLSVEQHQESIEKLTQLRTLIPQFTQLSAKQHLRIGSALVPDMARNAHDIHACIQHYLARTRDVGFSVHRFPPQPCGSLQLPIVKSESV